MLQVTPLLLGSFATMAAKSWLPLVRRLAVVGTMETETAGRPPPGAVESGLQAASRQRLVPISHRRSIRGGFMDPPAARRGPRRAPCWGVAGPAGPARASTSGPPAPPS